MTRVRRGRPTDEPALEALQAHLHEPSSDLLSHGLRTGDVRVSVADGTPVGYVVPVGGDGVHVAELVVHPDHRREGRAEELLCRVVVGADGTVTLLVAPDNEPALALYRKSGFAVTGRKPGFYDDGDALVMAHDSDGNSDRDSDRNPDGTSNGDRDGDPTQDPGRDDE